MVADAVRIIAKMTSAMTSSAPSEATNDTMSSRQCQDQSVDPVMILVVVLATLCFVGGVMSTVYMIRKRENQSRSSSYKTGGELRNVFNKVVPVLRPTYKPVTDVITCPEDIV